VLGLCAIEKPLNGLWKAFVGPLILCAFAFGAFGPLRLLPLKPLRRCNFKGIPLNSKGAMAIGAFGALTRKGTPLA